MTEYVLDAHSLVWHQEGNPRLGNEARRVLDDPASVLVLPVTALAEACWVVQNGRTSIPSAAALLAAVDADERIIIFPLTRDIVAKTLELPAGLEMHDRQIVATVLALAAEGRDAALLTRDKTIIASGLVRVVW